ncbi:MAG: response regulator [Anaerolineales bacterium]|jgi:DNA-binding response OmpR family regulator
MESVSENSQDLFILIVEDDPQLRKVMLHSIKNLGIPVLSSNRANEAIELCQLKSPDLVILDLEDERPQLNFVEALRHQDDAGVVLLSSNRISDELRSKIQPEEVIYKPFDTRYLCRRIVELVS